MQSARLALFAVLIPIAATASLAAAETVELVSINQMKRYLESSPDGAPAVVIDPGPELPEPEPTETVEVAVTETGPVLPEFTFGEAVLPGDLPKRLMTLVEKGLPEPKKWIIHDINEYVIHNDYVSAARFYAALDLNRQAAHYYTKMLGTGGATRKERTEVDKGTVGVETAYVLTKLGNVHRAQSLLTSSLEKAQENEDEKLITKGQRVWNLVTNYQTVDDARNALRKYAVSNPGTLEEKRTEAARLLALAALHSGRNDLLRAPGVPDRDIFPGNAMRALNGIKNFQTTPFEDMYPEFNRTTSIETLMGYRDLQAFQEHLNLLSDTHRLPMPRERARLLAELIARFPGHQVVTEGEALYMLVRDLGETGMCCSASELAEAGAMIYADTLPGRDGEFVYMAAEFAYHNRDWRRAYDGYNALRARFPQHRAVQMGLAGARVNICKEQMRKSGLIVH